MKKLILFLIISFFLIGCKSDDGSKEETRSIPIIQEDSQQGESTEIQDTNENNNSTNQVDESTDTNENTENTTAEIPQNIPETQPEPDPGPDPEPEIIPQPEPEVKIMIGLLFYDGSLKALNDDYSLAVLKENISSMDKAGDILLIDGKAESVDGKTTWDLLSPVKKSVIYGSKLFYYGTDNKLYMCDISGESTFLYENKNNYVVALTEGGVLAGFNYFFQDGSFEQAQYWGQDTVIKVEKIGSVWNKYKYDFTSSKWILVGQGYYSDFVKGSALILSDKIIFTRGATLFDNVLDEPVYNSVKAQFEGGNAFRQFIQPKQIKPIFMSIGAIGDIGYFLNARDGKVYKYDILTDSLVEWVQIVTGTGNDDQIESDLLFEKVNPVIIGNEIFYFDGTMINRIDVSTGEKKEVAQATNFKGWSL